MKCQLSNKHYRFTCKYSTYNQQ